MVGFLDSVEQMLTMVGWTCVRYDEDALSAWRTTFNEDELGLDREESLREMTELSVYSDGHIGLQQKWNGEVQGIADLTSHVFGAILLIRDYAAKAAATP